APSFPAWVAPTLLDVDPAEAGGLLEQLVDAQLVGAAGGDQANQRRDGLPGLCAPPRAGCRPVGGRGAAGAAGRRPAGGGGRGGPGQPAALPAPRPAAGVRPRAPGGRGASLGATGIAGAAAWHLPDAGRASRRRAGTPRPG